MPNDATTQLEIIGAVKTVVDKSSLAKSKRDIESTLSNIKVADGWNVMKNAIGSFGKTMAVAPMKKMASAIKDTTKHLSGFFAAIKRIAIYRAIRAALKAITQGFQEGIQNAYQWSVVTGNQFARSMDMMATSALYLKNSLGAMAMPLVNFLAPILDRLIDQFVELINIVNRFIATITGASSWVKALKYPAEYMEQAAGSAKELKRQLLGFDDLNVLNAPKSGGSASAMDYSSMFEQVELGAERLNFTKAFLSAVKNSDWDTVGELIDEYVNTTIENIDAKGIAKSLGDKLKTAIGLVHTLLRSVDFYLIGQKIAEFISNLNLDWEMIGRTWLRWSYNIASMFLGVIQNVNWSNVGRSIGEFVKGTLNGFADWLNELGTKEQSLDLGKWLSDVIAGVDWNGVLKAFYTALKALLARGFEAGLRAALGDKIADIILKTINLDTSSPAPTTSGRSAYVPTSGSGGGGRVYDPSMMANGGFPSQGTMFIAGESGAEFVGQIGGRTGVYNADQMANSLATANEGVVNTLVSVGNAIVGAINRKDTSINVTDIRRALNTTNMRYGV